MLGASGQPARRSGDDVTAFGNPGRIRLMRPCTALFLLGPWLLVAALAARAEDKKPPTLDDDLKVLQGAWSTGPEFVVSFRDKTMGILLGRDAAGGYDFTMEESNGKRYLVLDTKNLPKGWSNRVSYQLDGNQLLLTSEDGKLFGPKGRKLTRSEKKGDK
jgi:hypothetical protein